MKAFPRDADPQQERHIGIESELATNSGSYFIPLDIRVKLQKFYRNSHPDCGALEIVTHPISVKSLHQVRTPVYLKEYYNTIKSFAKVKGDNNGTHLHISVLDRDNQNLEVNALALATAFFPQFQKIAGRKTHWAVRHEFQSLEELGRFVRNCRYGSNQRVYHRGSYILTVTGHQTLEFRGPRGSVDGDEILAWAEFLENIVKVANRNSVEGVQFGQLLEGSRISEYVKSLKGARKIKKSELKMSLNPKRLYA